MTNKSESFKPFKPDGFSSFNREAHLAIFYKSVEWKSYSASFLKNNPICYCCGRKSDHTDHLRPHKGDNKLFWDRENHVPLCVSCHSYVTKRFDRSMNTEGKIAYLNISREKNELDFNIKITPYPKPK